MLPARQPNQSLCGQDRAESTSLDTESPPPPGECSATALGARRALAQTAARVSPLRSV